MKELAFFEHYAPLGNVHSNAFYLSLREECERVLHKMPELPFSHLYVAQQLHDKFPVGTTLHLGILSPLRSWGYFPLPKDMEVYCNQGGFGIDGNMSSMLEASLVNPEKLYYAVVGDLSFFYDMNVLGNRHMGNNVRILLINNALGAEFHLFKQLNLIKVNNIDHYLSAGGHFGKKSPFVVKHLAEDWGYEYLCASSKEDFEKVYKRFIAPELTDKPMIFEVFTDVNDENDALYKVYNIEKSKISKVKNTIKSVVGESMFSVIRKIKK